MIESSGLPGVEVFIYNYIYIVDTFLCRISDNVGPGVSVRLRGFAWYLDTGKLSGSTSGTGLQSGDIDWRWVCDHQDACSE